MHFFAMEVSLDSPHEHPEMPPKAYVSCWINDSSPESAFKKASEMIHNQGWSIVETLEDHPISRENYADSTEGLEYYEQALIDEEVIVFFVAKDGSIE